MTAKELTETYSSMIKEDAVDIFVIGDVEEDQVIEVMKDLPLKIVLKRSFCFYRQDLENIIREKIVREPVTQAKLNLGYRTGVYYNQPERFSLMVLMDYLADFLIQNYL